MDMGAGASKVPQARAGLVVTLDALGTIYGFREPITRQYIKVANRCGLTLSIEENELKKAFKKSFAEIQSEYPNYGKGQLGSPRAWWKNLINDAFRQVVNESSIPEHLGDELFDHFTSSAAYELFPDARPFFASMREIKNKLSKPDDPPFFVGIVSNSDPRVKSILQSLGLRVGVTEVPQLTGITARADKAASDNSTLMQSAWHHVYNPLNDVDFLATSYVADSEKPDAGIFGLASTLANMNYVSRLEQAREDWTPSLEAMQYKIQATRQMEDFKRSKYIHIGDDFDKDYLGAVGYGNEALYLARSDEYLKSDPSVNTVRNLEQAAAVINILVEQDLQSSKRDP